MFLALDGLFWFQITQKEETVSEIHCKVPLRGVDWADLKFPELGRFRRKKGNSKKKKRDKRRYGDGRNLAKPRAKKRNISPWETYGANKSADLGRRNMVGEHKGRPLSLYRGPVFGSWEFRAAFLGRHVSLTRCLNIIRAQQTAYISYICDPLYGELGRELFRSEAAAFPQDASTRCGPLLHSDILSQLSMISCMQHRVRTPAHATRLASYAADFGIKSGILGELYWWGSRRPESQRSVIRGYVLDVAVAGRTHRRGLFEKAFAHCGSYLSRRVDGGFAPYLYLWAPCLRQPTSVPDKIIVGMEMAECGEGAPPVDKASSPLLEGTRNLDDRPNILKHLKEDSGAAPYRHHPYELGWRLRIPRVPPIGLISSDEETGRPVNPDPLRARSGEVNEPSPPGGRKSEAPNMNPGDAHGRPGGGLGASGITYPPLFSDVDMGESEGEALESAHVDDPGHTR